MRGTRRTRTIAIATAGGLVVAAVAVYGVVAAVSSGDDAKSDTASVQGDADAVGSAVSATAPVGVGDSVIGPDGKVIPAGYRAMAAALATDKGIAYRFGPSAAAAGVKAGKLPTAYKPADKPLDVHGNGFARTYQVAGPQNPALDDYSSNQGQVAYVPGAGGSALGVDHVATLEMGQNTYADQPRLSWTYYGRGHPETEFAPDGVGYKCVKRIGASFGHTVALARAYAHGEAMASSFVAFDNGLIATAGHNTAQAGMCLQLPGGLVPSAVSVTDGNEFVLVTVWDTKTLTSKLAVIAVGGSRPKGQFWSYEWPELYPGIPNYGSPTFLKLLGLVDLPMAAPTGLSAVSDAPQGQQLGKPNNRGNAQRGDFPLSNEANRKTFAPGGSNRSQLASGGYAVVTSKSEHKVVFVDLQPLFDKITDAYFGSRSSFEKLRKNIGQRASQWPYAFSRSSAAKPTVLTTLTTRAAPTSVAASATGQQNPRAYVGTMDGRLHVYAAGGLATGAAAAAAQVKEVGTIKVGRNPTNITYAKDHASNYNSKPVLPDTLENTLIVTSRVDRRIDWVALSGDGGSIRRTLRDSRILDPIAAEDNNNHGTESYLLSIADYGAARLLNFRYGPVIFWTNGGKRYGMGRDGKAAFEYGGAYDPKGRPFAISVTNVS